MGAAAAAGVVGRWANNKKALPSASGVLQVIGALVLVSLLDSGKTEPIAKGLAALFAAAVLLGPDSPLTGLAKAESLTAAAPKTTPAQNNSDAPLPTLGPKGSRNTTQRTS